MERDVSCTPVTMTRCVPRGTVGAHSRISTALARHVRRASGILVGLVLLAPLPAEAQTGGCTERLVGNVRVTASWAAPCESEWPLLPGDQYARFYTFQLDRQSDVAITLEEGIRRMSSLTAERLGLRDRGPLQPGLRADIAIFDRERIESRCTIEKPREYATGIVHVLVNGRLAIRNGQRTDDDGGEVLRP